MIDTIILSLPRTKVLTLDLSGYNVQSWDLQAKTKNYHKFVKNPSPRDKESGLYFPRLTGYRRKYGKMEWNASVKIEFSAPKLLYENNLDELTDRQFGALVDALHDRLNRMGVVITKKDLIEADVMAVHYSKNIELQNGYTAQHVISELGKINLNKRFDLTKARYINDGQSLYAYTVAHSLIVYDKIADLKRDKKRAIDKEQPALQMNLFGQLQQASKEVLRFEVRLSQRQKMNAIFKQLGFAENPLLKDVFSTAKSKAVVNLYWQTMVAEQSLMLFAYPLTTKDLLKQVLLARKSAKGKTAIYLTGLLLLARDGSGMRELRAVIAKRANDRTWYRLVADLKETTALLNKLKPTEWYEQVCKAFQSYQPYRIKEVDVNKSKVIQ